MTSPATDLTGVWQGLYTYAQGSSVAFTATLIETASHLSGATHEACCSPHCAIPAHDALLSGRRAGSAIAFEKTYDPPTGGFRSVAYDGTLSADANEIEGRWQITGVGSGKFLMIRSTKTATAKTRGKLVKA